MAQKGEFATTHAGNIGSPVEALVRAPVFVDIQGLTSTRRGVLTCAPFASPRLANTLVGASDKATKGILLVVDMGDKEGVALYSASGVTVQMIQVKSQSKSF